MFLAFGENDSKYYDSAPFQEEKEEYYGFMFDLWFKNHTPNRKFAEFVEPTFKNGGYYRIDITD